MHNAEGDVARLLLILFVGVIAVIVIAAMLSYYGVTP